MKNVYFITSNKGKVHEVKTKLEPLGYKIIQKDLGYPEIQTDSLEEVAQFGVKQIQKAGIDHPFILEDAGIFIDALKGFPGVYSSYVYHSIGLDGILELMKKIVSMEKRASQFRSVFAYGIPEGEMETFIGTCNGRIATEKIGKKGFGYDPIFIPNGFNTTFAEMNTEDKNKISHRGRSLEKLISFLKK